MKAQEKIDRAADPSKLCLHKEGIFYKLSKQQAMLFGQNIKELKLGPSLSKQLAGRFRSML
jgi:hypothetical protein